MYIFCFSYSPYVLGIHRINSRCKLELRILPTLDSPRSTSSPGCCRKIGSVAAVVVEERIRLWSMGFESLLSGWINPLSGRFSSSSGGACGIGAVGGYGRSMFFFVRAILGMMGGAPPPSPPVCPRCWRLLWLFTQLYIDRKRGGSLSSVSMVSRRLPLDGSSRAEAGVAGVVVVLQEKYDIPGPLILLGGNGGGLEELRFSFSSASAD